MARIDATTADGWPERAARMAYTLCWAGARVFSIVAVLVVIGVLYRVGRSISITSVALSLILGGALGNLYDRMKFGYVVDFLEVHIRSYHWPDFNVADSAIVCGACLLLIKMLRPQRAD